MTVVDPRRRRGSRRPAEDRELDEDELCVVLRRASWEWLTRPPPGMEVVDEAVVDAPAPSPVEVETAAAPSPPGKRRRAPKQEPAVDGARAFRRSAWMWLSPAAKSAAGEAEAPGKRRRAPKREPVVDGARAFRRSAWAWLSPAAKSAAGEVEAPGKRRRAPKREPVVDGARAFRRSAWAWLCPAPAPAAPVPAPDLEVEAPGKRRRAAKRDPQLDLVRTFRRGAWWWFAPRASAGAGRPADAPPVPATDAENEVVRAHLRGVLEALIFASEHPLPARELARIAKAEPRLVKSILAELVDEYHGRGFRLDEVGGGFVFRTSPAFAPFVREQVAKKPVRMSRAQIETLAIVAYRQPVTRPEVDDVRGVDSGAVLKSLLERDFVRILGKKDEPGRPMLYGTTGEFLEFFGLKALGDLPTLREFTELTDESKRAYEREMGEEPLAEGELPPDDGLMGGEGQFRRGTVDVTAMEDPEPATEAPGAPPDEPPAGEREPEAGSLAVEAVDDADEATEGTATEPERAVAEDLEGAEPAPEAAESEAESDDEGDGDDEDEDDDEDDEDEDDDEDDDE